MQKIILVVDDDPDLVEMLQAALGEAGYAIRTAATGAEALSKAQHCPPDLVVLDLILPEMNGFSVCEALRRHPVTASVPIVMITALPGEFPRLAGMELGADAYVSKPFHLSEMVARVKSLLDEPGAGRGAICRAQPLAT